MDTNKKTQLEEKVREDFNSYLGHTLLVTGYLYGILANSDTPHRWHSDTTAYKVRVISTEDKLLLNWVGSYIYPVWRVEVINRLFYPDLAQGHAFRVKAPRYYIDDKKPMGTPDGWELDYPYPTDLNWREGHWEACVPALGRWACVALGRTQAEAIANVKPVMLLIINELKKQKIPLPDWTIDRR